MSCRFRSYPLEESQKWTHLTHQPLSRLPGYAPKEGNHDVHCPKAHLWLFRTWNVEVTHTSNRTHNLIKCDDKHILRDRNASFFFYFESSAAENDIITMQPSCCHLNLPVIIGLIMLAARRLMVTVLSVDGFFRRKWGSHFTHSHFPRSFHLHGPLGAAKVWKWHQFLRSGACTRVW